MILLGVNAGSSSLKFTAFDMPSEKVLISGYFERIGIKESFYSLKINGEKIIKECNIANHEEAVRILLKELLENNIISNLEEIEGIGHRVVHGGEKYSNSVIIDDNVIKTIEDLCTLAPLHNPANLVGINTFLNVLPNVPNVAVFDTAFHQTMDKDIYLYAIPYEWYENYGIRKYGFHGTSHKYINLKISEILNRNDLKVISCHLGSGGSIAAINSGKVVNTTMGFTPLAGIVMGTRSGDIDSSIIPYIMKQTNKTVDEVINDLNKNSGLFGISGGFSDARDIGKGIDEGNERCILAKDIYIRSIVNYIASYYVLLGGADVICFTAGVGENNIQFRSEIMKRLESLDIYIDEEKNNVMGRLTKISSDKSKVLCYIVPTDEEIMIARDTYELIR